MVDNLLGDLVSDGVIRSEQDGHAHIVKRSYPPVLSGTHMYTSVEVVAEGEATGVSVVVGQIEIPIERERMRHDLVMQIIAGACVRPVRDESPEHKHE